MPTGNNRLLRPLSLSGGTPKIMARYRQATREGRIAALGRAPRPCKKASGTLYSVRVYSPAGELVLDLCVWADSKTKARSKLKSLMGVRVRMRGWKMTVATALVRADSLRDIRFHAAEAIRASADKLEKKTRLRRGLMRMADRIGQPKKRLFLRKGIRDIFAE